MIVGRSKQLNEAPLLTAKHRDAERAAAEKRKAEKWPNVSAPVLPLHYPCSWTCSSCWAIVKLTTGHDPHQVLGRHPDPEHLPLVFPVSCPLYIRSAHTSIQPVYAFVRESLTPDAAAKPFTFYQPPRTTFPERPVPQPPAPKHINPAMRARVVQAQNGPQRGPNAAGMQGGTGGKETLSELGLVPQSMLLVRWEDAAMNCESASSIRIHIGGAPSAVEVLQS
jgi:tether containing UBX domain for GLUT4